MIENPTDDGSSAHEPDLIELALQIALHRIASLDATVSRLRKRVEVLEGKSGDSSPSFPKSALEPRPSGPAWR